MTSVVWCQSFSFVSSWIINGSVYWAFSMVQMRQVLIGWLKNNSGLLQRHHLLNSGYASDLAALVPVCYSLLSSSHAGVAYYLLTTEILQHRTADAIVRVKLRNRRSVRMQGVIPSITSLERIKFVPPSNTVVS